MLLTFIYIYIFKTQINDNTYVSYIKKKKLNV